MPILHLRASILSPGRDITPLKFRGWLRGEVESIDQQTRQSGQPHHASIIWIYVPERLRHGIGPAKLDKMLQAMVNRYETVYRIELHRTQETLTAPEMEQATDDLREYLASLHTPEDSPSGRNPPVLH